MDPLITVSQVHNKIYEMSNLYKKLLQGVNFIDVTAYVNTLNKLFKEAIIPHFEFEENKIFPLALSKNDPGIDSTVSKLLQEHKQMIGKLAQLNTLSTNLANNPDVTQREKDGLLSSCTELTRELSDHSQKEDWDLYPQVKEIIFKIN